MIDRVSELGAIDVSLYTIVPPTTIPWYKYIEREISDPEICRVDDDEDSILKYIRSIALFSLYAWAQNLDGHLSFFSEHFLMQYNTCFVVAVT